MVTKERYGFLDDGTEITKYTISNKDGEYAEFLDYGASIHGVYTRDRHGATENCVLQVSSPNELKGMSMEGSVIGRCANRIRLGRCEINGKKIQLETNQGKHFLHGASGNYAHRMFEGAVQDDQTVTFSLSDKGDGGFDNLVKVRIIYRFDDEKCLSITYDMLPEEATILCPTNHAYFNLGGLGDIRNHRLRIYSRQIAETDEDGIPNGEIIDVSGTVYDFYEERRISDAMNSDNEGRLKKSRDGYDNAFYFKESGMKQMAQVYCPQTGRSLAVYSDMEGLILFTPGKCSGKRSGGKEITENYAAFCLETQYMPNAVNCPKFHSPVHQAGERLLTTTRYVFGIRQEDKDGYDS